MIRLWRQAIFILTFFSERNFHLALQLRTYQKLFFVSKHRRVCRHPTVRAWDSVFTRLISVLWTVSLPIDSSWFIRWCSEICCSWIYGRWYVKMAQTYVCRVPRGRLVVKIVNIVRVRLSNFHYRESAICSRARIYSGNGSMLKNC